MSTVGGYYLLLRLALADTSRHKDTCCMSAHDWTLPSSYCMQAAVTTCVEELHMQIKIMPSSANIVTSDLSMEGSLIKWALDIALRTSCNDVLGLGWLTSNGRNHDTLYEIKLNPSEFPPPPSPHHHWHQFYQDTLMYTLMSKTVTLTSPPEFISLVHVPSLFPCYHCCFASTLTTFLSDRPQSHLAYNDHNLTWATGNVSKTHWWPYNNTCIRRLILNTNFIIAFTPL